MIGEGGVSFTIRIWTKGNIPEMEQRSVGADTACCIGTTSVIMGCGDVSYKHSMTAGIFMINSKSHVA
jgi:hypothetical protein